MHDFTAKLRQPALRQHVVDYVAWQRARRAARAAGRAEPALPEHLGPISINLDLTTACNYRCDHCIDWDILNSKVRHADDELRASLKELAQRGLRSVILIGGGEPTLYPGFADFVRYLKEELKQQVAVVSNGSRNDRLLAAAAYFGPGDWVRLSLDSGSNELFRAMHKPSKDGLDLDEICRWIPQLKAASPELTVGFSFIITWRGSSRGDVAVIENLGEIELAARRARDAGFDYISYKPFLLRTEAGSEIMDPHRAQARLDEVRRTIGAAIARAKELEDGTFRVVESSNLKMLMDGSWRAWTKQPRMCHMQALRQVLTPLGIYNCPAHRGVRKAELARLDGYKDGEAVRRTQAGTGEILDRFDASVECAEVTCLYHGTNWWIERMIESAEPLDAIEAAAERNDYFL